MKTGTSSIQDFLYKNQNLLKIQKTLYPNSIKNSWHLNDHNPFAHAIEYFLEQANFSSLDSYLKPLKQEINNSHSNKVIVSTENIQFLLYNEKYIQELQIILKNLGFTKIYIIIYLRNPSDLFISMCSQALKDGTPKKFLSLPSENNKFKILCHHEQTLKNWGNIFKKENLIVKLFSKNEFYQGDLLKDFINTIGLEWDNNFIIPDKQNETLDLLGMEILNHFNNYSIPMLTNRYVDFIVNFFDKHFTSKDPKLKFQPPKEIYQSYIDYFEESNEWVRKEFFPHKERLFPKKDMNTYKENYELKEMKPEYWDKIAEFIADIIKTNNENILGLNQTLEIKNQELRNQTNQIHNLNKTLNFQNNYGKAKIRIQNQLSYKLGQALIINSKSVLGFLSLPFIILSIVISHKQEQKAYKFKVKKNPNLALPPLETYPDYNEALKEKECFTYKLGEEFIKASKNWYGGGDYSYCLIEFLNFIRNLGKNNENRRCSYPNL
ncbi:putative sulfotransferase [Campylobacter jejuni subsp. jejuni]|nr:putative sulfotransferase [Campylobacter jejuni subsp. jejuni]